MTQAVAPAPECPYWTGFYIGGDVGYKFTNTDLKLDLFGNWDTPNNDVDKAAILSEAPRDLDTDAFEAGGLIGYNAQIGHFVIGAEASGNYLSADEARTSNLIVPHPGVFEDSDITLRTSFESHYLMTVAPRIGWAFCRFLPYVTGGLAVGEIKYSQDIIYNNPGALGFRQGGSINETATGWMAAGGLQYAITDHWSVRAQYQYIDLGEAHFRSEGDTTPPGQLPGFFGEHQIELKEHNASFAIMYKF